MSFKKGRKNLTLLTFGCPIDNVSVYFDKSCSIGWTQT